MNKADTRMKRYRKKKKGPIVFKVVLIVFLVTLLGSLAYGAKLLFEAEDLFEDNFRPRSHGQSNNNDNIQPKTDPFTILLLGVDDNDERELGSNRTDTIILVTVDPKQGKISMVSIPRDTYTHIQTKKFVGNTKINAAYTYGEEEGTISAVEELTGIHIDFYVTVDFEAFEKIVDELGGINIDVPVAISEANASVTKMIELEPGNQTLNGEEALAFARTRKIDNDIMRGERQQMVVQSVISKAMDAGSITKYSKVLQSLHGHFWTDMNSDTMMQIAKSGLTKKYAFESYTFSWMSFNYDGASMVGLHQDSLDFITHRMKVSLGLEPKDERDAADYEFETDGIVSPKTYPEFGAVDDE